MPDRHILCVTRVLARKIHPKEPPPRSTVAERHTEPTCEHEPKDQIIPREWAPTPPARVHHLWPGQKNGKIPPAKKGLSKNRPHHALLNFFPQTHDERFLSSLPPKMMLLGWKNGVKEGIVIQPELPDGKCDTVRNVKPPRESHVMYTNKGCKNEIYKSQRNNNG